MPRLSIYRPEKGKDYKFFDRNIKELFQVGGTDIYIHKYMGPHDQGETNDATQPKRAVIDQMSIQDLLLLENRDRKYESDVYYARGIYNVTDVDFDLTQFGLFMQNDSPFITFHQRDIIERLGRRLMSGDVLELPHRKDDFSLDETMLLKVAHFLIHLNWHTQMFICYSLVELVDWQHMKDFLNTKN